MTETLLKTEMTFEDFKAEVLNDYKTARISRECSLLGRKEVLTGKGSSSKKEEETFGSPQCGHNQVQLLLTKYQYVSTDIPQQSLWIQ